MYELHCDNAAAAIANAMMPSSPLLKSKNSKITEVMKRNGRA